MCADNCKNNNLGTYRALKEFFKYGADNDTTFMIWLLIGRSVVISGAAKET
jgi:hypothetical protein